MILAQSLKWSSWLFLLGPYLFLSLSYATSDSLAPKVCFSWRTRHQGKFFVWLWAATPFWVSLLKTLTGSLSPDLSWLSLAPPYSPGVSALSSLLEFMGASIPHSAVFYFATLSVFLHRLRIYYHSLPSIQIKGKNWLTWFLNSQRLLQLCHKQAIPVSYL